MNNVTQRLDPKENLSIVANLSPYISIPDQWKNSGYSLEEELDSTKQGSYARLLAFVKMRANNSCEFCANHYPALAPAKKTTLDIEAHYVPMGDVYFLDRLFCCCGNFSLVIHMRQTHLKTKGFRSIEAPQMLADMPDFRKDISDPSHSKLTQPFARTLERLMLAQGISDCDALTMYWKQVKYISQLVNTNAIKRVDHSIATNWASTQP